MKIYINANYENGSGTNGNPRRAYLVYEIENGFWSHLIDVIYEGNCGRSELIKKYPDAVEVYTEMTLSNTEKEMLK